MPFINFGSSLVLCCSKVDTKQSEAKTVRSIRVGDTKQISDFGLAKICHRKESNVSIFGARGTPGYIAPELFSRHFGGVSHKSDVYSYGMMVLEI
jgi:serine/threonine protein kinase